MGVCVEVHVEVGPSVGRCFPLCGSPQSSTIAFMLSSFHVQLVAMVDRTARETAASDDDESVVDSIDVTLTST